MKRFARKRLRMKDGRTISSETSVSLTTHGVTSHDNSTFQYILYYHEFFEPNCSADFRRGHPLCLKYSKVKVKVTLEQATKAQRGSRGIALLVL